VSRRIFDAAVIGAGAAGMMAAADAARRGLRVVLIDHASRLAEKIRISGGGRCNFTNIGASPANFISQNPDFCRSALKAYTPQDFIDLIERHGVSWHEKHRGQLFCDESSESIIRLLKDECDRAGVNWRMPCAVDGIVLDGGEYVLATGQGALRARQLVLATGGMAIPQLGATDFSLRVARQFGLKVIEPRPALVPLMFDNAAWQPFAVLAGLGLEVRIAATPSDPGARRRAPPAFLEDVLFTHRGLSGPAVLQISSYWQPGTPIHIDLAPQRSMEAFLLENKRGNRQQLDSVLAQAWPRRLAEQWLGHLGGASLVACRLADVPDRVLRDLARRIHHWTLQPSGTAGYKKAEVMRGGVDTRDLEQRTMQAVRMPGLYVIGEAVDVTGWLGGYNFQWAWASGYVCGQALRAE
jgi:predicted Rossmann fold flavoprotein